jgi:predicted nucleic acid-binding protein
VKTLNLVDSCGWLEYFADGPNAAFFAPPIENVENLLVPTICILEVFKRVVRQKGENAALQAVAAMEQGHVVGLDASIAMTAARLGVELGLPLADSVVLASAQAQNAQIWTQDADFRTIPGIKYARQKNR